MGSDFLVWAGRMNLNEEIQKLLIGSWWAEATLMHVTHG
jgi:hypothetical protein